MTDFRDRFPIKKSSRQRLLLAQAPGPRNRVPPTVYIRRLKVTSRDTVPLDAVFQPQLAVECPDKGSLAVSDDIGAVVSFI